MPRRRFAAVVLLLLPAAAPAADPARVVYPPGAGQVDVTRPPYNARGDGVADDTAAIQKALDDHPNAGAIIYLPRGTYKITDTLRWPQGPRGGMEQKNTILEGESRDGSVLRLADRAPGFGDPKQPKAMVWTGKAPAQRFRNALRNMTFDTGAGNPGAVAAQFMANNQGTVHAVTFRAGDAGGPVGLDLGYTNENGPLLLRDVRVEGFDVGVRLGGVVNSVTAEDLTVRGQKVCGVQNNGQVLSVRRLVSDNAVPAVVNAKGPAVLTLIDAKLTGTGAAKDTAAVVTEATLFARNLSAPGYAQAVDNRQGDRPGPDGLTVAEYVNLPTFSLFDTRKTSLGLPVEEVPAVPADDPATWESVTKHGAGGNTYQQRERNDDTAGFQKAIDSGATTVVVPRGFYVLNDTVRVRGKVRRILFMESQLVGGKGFKGTDKPAFRFEDGTADVVVLERFNETYGSHAAAWIEHASQRTLVVRNAIHGKYTSVGGGRVFFDDVCGGPFLFAKQDVWARQLNQETKGLHVRNDGGRLWLLGYKTERSGTLLETVNGGQTEVLGGFSYGTTGVSPDPMFVVRDSAFSATMGEAHFGGHFPVIVRETRGGVTRDLGRKEVPSRYGIGALLPLYATDRPE